MLQHRLVGSEDELLQTHFGTSLALLGGREVFLAHHDGGEVGPGLAGCSFFIRCRGAHGGLGEIDRAFADRATGVDAEHLATHRCLEKHDRREEGVHDADGRWVGPLLFGEIDDLLDAGGGETPAAVATEGVVDRMVQNEIEEGLAMQIVHVVRLEVDVEGDLPVGAEVPTVVADDLVRVVTAPPQLGLDVGEGRARVGALVQSDGDEAGDIGDGERFEAESHTVDSLERVSIGLSGQ